MRRLAAVLVLIGSIALDAQRSYSPPLDRNLVVAVLDAYSQGEYELAERRLQAVFRGGGPHLAAFADSLEAAASEWMRRAALGESERSRLVIAAAAIEAVNNGGVGEWQRGRALIEWACAVARRNGRPLEAERAWHHAAIAVLEAAGDSATLQAHLAHALPRFPGDSRMLLARGVSAEERTWPDPRDGRTPRERDGAAVEAAVTHFTEALPHQDVRGEASLHLGLLALRNGDIENAISQLSTAETDRDAFVRHLAYVFHARALERRHEEEGAVGAYRAALAAAPGQTAQIGLASSLLKAGARHEASETMAAALREQGAIDPWVLYGRGDARLWAGIVQTLHHELRQ